jgi:hypothetical protein
MVDEFQENARELTRRGVLAEYLEAAAVAERRRLRAETYEIVQPVVFTQLTRKLEIKRGHYRCAVSVHMLDDDCLDRFHDDMDAVLDDVFRNARVPIQNFEGWISRRLTAATIDAHRRRRGERGALQRPRIPGWLAAKLGEDPRLMALAVEMLEFVGVDVSAGTDVWPIDTWASERATTNGDYEAARRAVTRDVSTVVDAMRSRPKWYDDYVERPLGRKRAPLLQAPPDEPDALELPAPRGDAEDARLTELAAVAVAAVEHRLARGEDARTVVVDVLTTVFGADIVPGRTFHASIDRLVAEVLAILADEGC